MPPSGPSNSAPPCNQAPPRSEEHTSELQSQSNIVCRLLLEKKTMERLAEGEVLKGQHGTVRFGSDRDDLQPHTRRGHHQGAACDPGTEHLRGRRERLARAGA